MGILSSVRRDLVASLVVFLVALPLCLGVAVASGVPAEVGVVTGIVGGLVVGPLPGSSLQVSGPAAGLTVLVFDAVRQFGLQSLGVLVLVAGALQVAMGVAQVGRWFRAVSVSVVHGMLAGIGLVLVVGQLYALGSRPAPAAGLARVGGLPGLVVEVAGDRTVWPAVAVGAGVAGVLALWGRLPGWGRLVPGQLVAVALATGLVWWLRLPVARVRVEGLASAVHLPSSAGFVVLTNLAGVGTALAFALIASAESLFSAAAVDRMHQGRRTQYDRELVAQGVGNAVCGLLGALPLTAVMVRSSTNVRAGARTKLSRVAHGVWLLVFVVGLPWVVESIPLAALAGVLVHAGCRLIPGGELVRLWRRHRGEAVVLSATAVAVVVTNLFEGVLLGLLLAMAKTAWQVSLVQVRVVERAGGGPVVVALSGNATFLQLPRMLDVLDALPGDRPVELDLSGLRHMDHACRTALADWAAGRCEVSGDVLGVPLKLGSAA